MAETTKKKRDQQTEEATIRFVDSTIDQICELVAALETAKEEGSAEYNSDVVSGRHTEEEMQQIIQEHPVEVRVRSDWHKPTEFEAGNSDFYILLCADKPTVRILGELDHLPQVTRARVQYQDSGVGWWEILDMKEEQQRAILEYCHQFNFAG